MTPRRPRNTSEHERMLPARHNTARHAESHEAALTRALDFSKLIAMSSLGSPDARDDRLTGRKELNDYLAREAAGGQPPPHFSITAGQLDPAFELQVADQLELRGHTLEAELRYRRLQATPEVAKRLGVLLDAKGFHHEAWQWYLRAACANDINSLFRLATICWRRGSYGWATRLAKHAVGQLTNEVYADLLASIEDLSSRRTSPKRSDRFLRRSLPRPTMDSNATYALGSVLLILAGRPDLARLAYCSALTGGHSLAAVSLLDLTRDPWDREPESWRLRNLLRYGLDERQFEQYRPVEEQRDDFDRALTLLKSRVQSDPFEKLLDSIRAYLVDSRASDRGADAVERVIYTTRLITCLRGYAQLGYDVEALPDVDGASDRVCQEIHRALLAGTVGNATSLITRIRDLSTRELGVCQGCEWTNSASMSVHNTLCTRAERKEKKSEAEEERRRKHLAMSGTVGRLGYEYSGLSSDQRDVLILRLAGLDPEEVAGALGHTQQSQWPVRRHNQSPTRSSARRASPDCRPTAVGRGKEFFPG